MRLVLTVGGVDLEFTERAGEYPWLVKVGTLLLNARAGHLDGAGLSEAPNVSVELDNYGKQASRMLGHFVRVPVTIYDDDDEVFFAGAVASVSYGRTLVITVES